MAKKARGLPADKLELYEKLVATKPDVKRKGKTVPYTSMNGHMYSFLTKEGTLALRLPAKEREQFLEGYGTNPVEQYGRIMKEYVEVPGDLLADTAKVKAYFDISYDYVSSLKPK